jgi:hypothetical protein
MGLQGATVVQSTVYAAVFFSIVLCAALVFAVERGLLNPFAAAWLGKYAAAKVAAGPRPAGAALLIEPALAPPDLTGLQEPNPVRGLDATVGPAGAPGTASGLPERR